MSFHSRFKEYQVYASRTFAWIYHGPTITGIDNYEGYYTGNINNAAVYNGQIIYIEGIGGESTQDDLEGFIYSKVNGEMKIIADVRNSNGTYYIKSNRRSQLEAGLYPIAQFNAGVYGSKYAHRSGSKYSIRPTARLLNDNYTSPISLTLTSQKVAINKGQGYCPQAPYSTPEWNLIRCDGYYNSAGQFIETSNKYVELSMWGYISNYKINTY